MVSKTRSPASSESGYLADFHEEESDYGGDLSNQLFSETFDIDQNLDFTTVQSQSPISPQSPVTCQAMAHGSSYNINNINNRNQSSLSYGTVLRGSIPLTGNNTRDMVIRIQPAPLNYRNNFLRPPSPSSLRRACRNCGSGGHLRTVPELSSTSQFVPFNKASTSSQGLGSPVLDQILLAVDSRRPGPIRTRSPPDRQGKAGMHRKPPYERPVSRTGTHNATRPFKIPGYVNCHSLEISSAPTTPDLSPVGTHKKFLYEKVSSWTAMHNATALLDMDPRGSSPLVGNDACGTATSPAMLSDFGVTLDHTLINFDTNISPWKDLHNWNRANATHISLIMQNFKLLTKSNGIDKANPGANMMYPVSFGLYSCPWIISHAASSSD